MFLNSLVGCLWGEDTKNSQLNNTLRWSNKITYSGNFILLEGNNVKIEGSKVDIATDTYDFIVQNSNELFQVKISSYLHCANCASLDEIFIFSNQKLSKKYSTEIGLFDGNTTQDENDTPSFISAISKATVNCLIVEIIFYPCTCLIFS